jgi:hypothetical protein
MTAAAPTWLTGITTTGTPHIGNYVGAIRPGIEASRDPSKKNYFFLADLHALVKAGEDPEKINRANCQSILYFSVRKLDTQGTLKRTCSLPGERKVGSTRSRRSRRRVNMVGCREATGSPLLQLPSKSFDVLT